MVVHHLSIVISFRGNGSGVRNDCSGITVRGPLGNRSLHQHFYFVALIFLVLTIGSQRGDEIDCGLLLLLWLSSSPHGMMSLFRLFCRCWKCRAVAFELYFGDPPKGVVRFWPKPSFAWMIPCRSCKKPSLASTENMHQRSSAKTLFLLQKTCGFSRGACLPPEHQSS